MNNDTKLRQGQIPFSTPRAFYFTLSDQGQAAEAHTTTVFRLLNESIVRHGDEKWFFRKANGRWRIVGLYYGFPGFSQ